MDDKTKVVVNSETDFKALTLENIDFSQAVSILEHVPNFMKAQLTGNPLMDELSIWYNFNQSNLIEKKDKSEIRNFIKSSVKLGIISMLIGGILNRGVTLIKIKNREFMNLHFIFRFLVRSSIFGACLLALTFQPMFYNFIKLHYYMNVKYAGRYKRYNENCDPLEMNPFFLADESLSKEEKEIQKLLYDKIRGRQTMMMMQAREMDRMERMENKKI